MGKQPKATPTSTKATPLSTKAAVTKSAAPPSPCTCTAEHCRLAYAVAFGAALSLAARLEARWPGAPLFNGLIITCACTTVVYLFSLRADNSSVYDPYWVLAPLHLAFVWKAQAPGGFWFYEPRETLCIVLLWAWAVRFIVMVPWEGWRTGLTHEDWRYAQLRARLGAKAYWPFSFTSLHLTPTLLVYGALCPLGRVILQGDAAPPLNALDAAAALVTAAGIGVEGVADETLRRWQRANPGARTAFRGGLWRYSRHPNYCGECLFWTGLLLFAAAAGALQAEGRLAAGAASMWAFFRLASVPLMDARSLERRSDYAEVMRSTSALLLLPSGR